LDQFNAISIYSQVGYPWGLLLHFPPLQSAPAFSTPAFSVAPQKPVPVLWYRFLALISGECVMDKNRQAAKEGGRNWNGAIQSATDSLERRNIKLQADVVNTLVELPISRCRSPNGVPERSTNACVV